MKNIYLVGFMGTGKTTVGKILSQKLCKEFVEMDTVIEERERKKIVDIFSSSGEAYFRQLEKKLLDELSQREDLVVSCGGGLICNQDNLRILKNTGAVFNIKASPLSIYGRIKNDSFRPLLNVSNPLAKIEELLNKRETYYNQAHCSIDTDRLYPEAIADKIIAIIQAERV